jgi:hypothetical protein
MSRWRESVEPDPQKYDAEFEAWERDYDDTRHPYHLCPGGCGGQTRHDMCARCVLAMTAPRPGEDDDA